MVNFFEAFQKCVIPESLKNEVYDRTEKLVLLQELNKVNIFIGSNNSGKSKLLREILKVIKDTHYGNLKKREILILIETLFGEVESLRKLVGNHAHHVLTQYSKVVLDFDHASNIKKEITRIDKNYDLNRTIDRVQTFFNSINLFEPTDHVYINSIGLINNRIENPIKTDFLKKITYLKNHVFAISRQLLLYSFPDLSNYHKIYIPGVRTLRPFASRANIENDTRKEYHFPDAIKIHNGQNLPQEIQNLKNASYAENKKIEEFQNFLKFRIL